VIYKDSSDTANLAQERTPGRRARRFRGSLSRRAAIGLLLPLLPAIPAGAQAVDAAGADGLAAFDGIPSGNAATYKSGNRPDPFYHLSEATIANLNKKNEDVEISRGTPPPGIAGTFISKAELEGISIRSDRRTAVVRGADNRAYFLHEGDRLFDGYLQTIKEDSVVLIRETRMQSGKVLTQDVIKRLRKP